MTAKGQLGAPTGVLIIDKPSGPTSFDVVAQVRRTYRTKSVGHAGTLDPLATGVLVVMLGEATKLSEYLTAQQKSYNAHITFGRSTDTLDSLGSTLEERALGPHELSLEQIEAAITMELARSEQIPPAFSAIKLDGETAYKKARRGEALTLPPRPVTVERLTIEDFTGGTLTLSMTVSKGYYVRSLVRDLCETLGVPGCLTALRRSASGAFTLDGAISWPPPPGETPSLLALVDAARCALALATLTPDGVVRARQGKRLTQADFVLPPTAPLALWVDEHETPIALGQTLAEESEVQFRVVRGFRAPTAGAA